MATVKLKNMPDWLKVRLGIPLQKKRPPKEAKVERTINPEQNDEIDN